MILRRPEICASPLSHPSGVCYHQGGGGEGGQRGKDGEGNGEEGREKDTWYRREWREARGGVAGEEKVSALPRQSVKLSKWQTT